MNPTLGTTARAEYRAAAGRSLDFLAAAVNADAKRRKMIDEVDVLYKLPYVFTYGGRRELGLRVMEHIENDLIEADGSFRDASQNGPTSMYAYMAGWLAWGSLALGRFDLARRFARRIAVDQDPQWGGHWSESEVGRAQWLLTSSGMVAGCAAAGELETAERGARYMARLLERQPRPDDGFYFNLGPDGEVVTKPAEDTTTSFYDFNDRVRPAMFAIALAGLVWTGEQTGDARHFDLARRYANVVLSNRRDPTTSPFVSKTGWAALLLYRHRADDDLRGFAEAVGKAYLRRQQSDGSVALAGWPGLDADQPVGYRVLTTCDWVVTALALANGGA